MAVVVDANLIVVLAVDDDRAAAVESLLQDWSATSEELHAPDLLLYEVANALTRLVAANAFPRDRVPPAWRTVQATPITYHSLDLYGLDVVAMALQLRRQSAYDAAYLALADRLGAELWTFDGPLARNATSLGFPVHLVGPSVKPTDE